MAIDMRLEVNSFFLNLSHSGKRKYLKTAGICQNRAVPIHKFMQTAKLLDQLISRSYMKMIRIGQLYLCMDFL